MAHALNLLGDVCEKPNPANAAAESLRVNAFAARAERDPDEVDDFWGVCTKHLEPEARRKAIEASLPDRATAQSAVAAIIAAEVARLEARRELVWQVQEKDVLADVANRASFDRCDEAILMQRYETAHSLDLHRCLGQLAKMRKAESAGEAAPQTAFQPAAERAPEPAVEPAAAPPQPIRNEPTAAGTNGQETGSAKKNSTMNGSNGHPGALKSGSRKQSGGPKEVVETSAKVSALV